MRGMTRASGRKSQRSPKGGMGAIRRSIKKDEQRKPATDFQKPVKSSLTEPNCY